MKCYKSQSFPEPFWYPSRVSSPNFVTLNDMDSEISVPLFVGR